jgi:hypothetical protein
MPDGRRHAPFPVGTRRKVSMSKKMMLLATALTALAFAALPAMASAGTPQTHCPSVSGSTCSFSGTSSSFVELSRTANSLKIHCSQTTTSGTMSTSGGSVQFLFHGCTDNLFGLPATTSGQSSGTITTTLLSYDNIYATDDKTKPAVLITPNAGHFASFSTAAGATVVSGNGVIGTLTSPGCGATAASVALSFTQSSNGHQAHKQSTGTGTIFDLTGTVAGAASTSAQVGSGTAAITGGSVTVTCV